MSSASSVQSSSTSLQSLPLGILGESPTNPRKHFDAAKLEELGRSIKEVGVLEPLIVRRAPKNGNGCEFEIVCGARRYRASRLAGLNEVPATVRTFTDDQVRLIQLAENGAREDLSPLDEAEAYAALAVDGLDPSAIAKALGKKTREVARRLPLATLAKCVKDALVSGLLPVGHGEYLARIPDAKLQEEALGRFLYDANDGEGKPIVAAVPLAVAKRIVEEEFMTSLSVAIFDPEDATLSPLGACSKCPHLAGNNPDLFGDVKAKSVCTNPKDFRLKVENHLTKLRESGYTVLLSKNEVKPAFPYAASDELGKEFVDLERVCVDDPKRRTYEELLGRGEKLKTVFALKNGRVRKLYPAKDIRVALVASGHSFAKEKKPQRPGNGQDASRSAARLEDIGKAAVSREFALKLRSVKLTPGGWIDLLVQIAILLYGWRLENALRRHGFDGTAEEFAKKRERIVAQRIAAMSDAEKRAFLVDLLIGDWIRTADKAEQELYRHALKLAGVNYVKVANGAIDAAKKKAAESKQTSKPPIAAKVVRAPKN